MTTDLMIREEAQGIVLQWEPEDLQALKQTVAADCDVAQFKVFVAAAKRLGLDPFARQIVPIVQGKRMTPQVTIDGFRLIAQRTGQYAGQIGPFWCGPDGEWREVWLSETTPVAAKVGVLRRDFAEPMWGVARTAAYRGDTPTWRKMPDVMIAKVAESLALRKAFPQELSGVYTAEEMTQAQEESVPAYVEPAPNASAEHVPQVSKSQLASISNLAKWLGREVPHVETAAEATIIIREWGKDWQTARRAPKPAVADAALEEMGTVTP